MDINDSDSNQTTCRNDDERGGRVSVTEHADDAPACVMDADDKTTIPNEQNSNDSAKAAYATTLSNSVNENHIDDSHGTKISAKCIENLCKGMVQNMIPDLEKAKVSVDEAIRNQEVLIETVQQENTKFIDCTSMGHLVEMMHEAKSYYNKLMTVKKDMNLLSDKTQRLKRRAVKLQQQKQKEEQYLIQRRERELEKEQHLIARVAKKSETPLPSNTHDSNTV